MRQVREGQCGRCKYFGDMNHDTMVQIRQTGEAPEELVATCHHAKHADLHLKVTPISSCDGYEPARQAAEAA